MKELDFISYDVNTGLRIGALATISALISNSLISGGKHENKSRSRFREIREIHY
jgi:hypothetical protein